MYRPNKRHLQPLLISNINDLPDNKKKRLEQSWAHTFYREFFCRLNEDAFSVLYVDHPSRPNVPINWLVGLETLKAGFGWSDEELYDHFCFDLQVRYALGLRDISEGEFDLRSLYYFRERLSQYNLEHGINLLKQAFENITDQQLTILKIKAGQQRMDSTMVASNILGMSRLQLLVEALQRMYRILSEEDQKQKEEIFMPYMEGHSGQYVYRIKGKKDIDEHLEDIGLIIHSLLAELKGTYDQQPAYQVLNRCFEDNFVLVEQKVQAKQNKELRSDSLQSLDDLEATYRKKGQLGYKGFSANLSETCDPHNDIQLITSVQVASNNIDDTQLLVEALPNLKERTGVEVLYTDGAFAGPTVDPILAQCQVELLPTGIRGREPSSEKLNLADFELELEKNNHPVKITCPQGQVVAVFKSKQGKSFQADFDCKVCDACSLKIHCSARPGKKRATHRLTFTTKQISVAQRRRKMKTSQPTGKNLRAAIEGTIREVKHPFASGKLPVRGLFRVTAMIISSVTMTNVRRIYHSIERKRKLERKMKTQKQKRNEGIGSLGFSFFQFSSCLSKQFFTFMAFRKLNCVC